MIYGGDFRVDYSPASARRRRDYFSSLLSALEAREAIEAATGKPQVRGSVEMSLERLLRAQVHFADAQIEASTKATKFAGEAS